MSEIQEERADQIVAAIDYFKTKLEETNLQHDDVKAFGEIIRDYASWIISSKLRNA